MDEFRRAVARLRPGPSGAAVAVAALGALVAVGVMAVPADAHEERVIGDNITADVGWAEEPTFTHEKNRVQVTLTDADDEPVTELNGELNVEVIFGDGAESREFPLEAQFGPNFGAPGEYGVDIVPTRPGTYTFRLFGTIDGEDVDESFTSGPDTFDEPREAGDIQFPVSDPSTSQLAERLERELARLGGGAAAENGDAEAADAAADDADDAEAVETEQAVAADGSSSDSSSDAGTVLGIVGIVLAAVAIAGSGLALKRSRT